MKETKPEIYKIFKKSLNEPFFNCNKRLLGVKIDTAVKKCNIFTSYIKRRKHGRIAKRIHFIESEFS